MGDIKIISQWKNANNEYAVLTTYPPGIQYSSVIPGPRMICGTNYLGEGDQWMLKHGGIANLPLSKTPFLSGYTAAGFLFSKTHRAKFVPNDKYGYNMFDGEEFGLGVRMFTWGYDFYAPGETIITHKYFSSIDPRPRFWTHGWEEKFPIQKRSRYRMWAAIGHPISDDYDDDELENFTIGSYRTVKSYVDWLGVDIDKFEVKKDFCQEWKTLKRVPGIPGKKLPLELLGVTD